MRRYLRTFLAMYFCAVLATFFVSYPQASFLDAPERGWMATSVTLTLFFGIGLFLITLVAALLASGLRALSARLADSTTSSRSMQFVFGAVSIVAVLMATPYSRDPADVLGLGTAWVVSGGVGMLSVTSTADTLARLRWRTVIHGALAAIGAGLAALAVQAFLGRA